MLVEIITSLEINTLQNKINDFFIGVPIVVYDIKLSQSEDAHHVHHTAMIIYKKIDDDRYKKQAFWHLQYYS
jgi:hypothetical protein